MALSGPRYPARPLIEEDLPRPRMVAQQFRPPGLNLRARAGEVRFTSADTVNTTTKRLSSAPIVAERVLVMNRGADDAGVAAAGNDVLVGEGPNAYGQQLPINSAVELLNANLGDIAIAYSGAVSLAGAAFVLVGWMAHGVVRTGGEKDITAAAVSGRP